MSSKVWHEITSFPNFNGEIVEFLRIDKYFQPDEITYQFINFNCADVEFDNG